MKRLWIATLLVAVAVAPAVAQMAADEPVEVALRVDGGRLMVPLLADDGTELEFLVSTGSAATVLSESLAARLGSDGGLTLGGVPVPTEAVDTVPDEQLGAGGRSLDGMIGSNLLNQFDVLVDVPGERLVLKPVGESVAWEGMTLSDPVRLRIYHGIVVGFDVELEDREYPALLDLGRPALVVNEGVKQDTRIDDEDVGTLAIGDERFPDLPVRVLDLEIFRRWSPDGDGVVLVGAPVAYDCAISISWVHREMRTCVR